MSFKKFAAAESAVNKATPVKSSKAAPMVGPPEKPVDPADKTSATETPSDKS